jgi:hypothetical protein
VETVEAAAEAERRRMNITKCINSVFLLFLIPFTIGLDVQAQPQQNRNNTRQVGNMLQRLERSSCRFRSSLNVALVQRSVDQTKPQNDISTFQYSFDLAIEQFRDQFTRRLAVASDVESILEKAQPINSFITRNTSNPRVKNDWASVRTDLNTLASAYGVSSQWNQLTPLKVDSNRSFRLSENELTQLILLIEEGGDQFRLSLTDAFFQGPYDRTRNEGNMNDALRSFKQATNQVRIRFDARQLVLDDVQRLLDQAQPLENFMRDNALTDHARSDWSTLRKNLNILANAYNISPSWINIPSSQTESKLIVQDGEILVAILNNNLNIQLSQHGDLFTVTVRDPSQLLGAVIEGSVGKVSDGGLLRGWSEMALTFETIRLPNGQSYKFTGILESVRTLNGDTIKVDNDGSAQTIQRVGIATGVGAVIGAGSVFIPGTDNLELPSGTELTIRSSRRQ